MAGDTVNAYSILVGIPEGKRSLGRPWRELHERITVTLLLNREWTGPGSHGGIL
jgi:hypothetical protein